MPTKDARFASDGVTKGSDQTPSDRRKKEVIEALDKRFKELNKLWAMAEADLKQIPIPVDVCISYKSVPADPQRPDEYQIHYLLGFAQTQDGWRICQAAAHDGFPDDDPNWKPITDCTLDVRLEAAPHIGKLREEVLNAAERCVPKLDEAIAAFHSAFANR